MAPLPKIINADGSPMIPVPAAPRARASLAGSAPQFFPYDSANWSSQEMGDWLPWIRSPDNEINYYRDRMVARQRDLVRNDGWGAGVVIRLLDNTIGAHYRLIAAPDLRRLQLEDPAFDRQWLKEFKPAAEALWRDFAEDLGHWNDVERKLSVTQQFRLAMRHEIVDGESLAVASWDPERIGYGAGRYATCFQVIDPDRLSNPYQMVDTKYLRGGVEISETGEPLAYHIRRAHQNDWYNAVEAMEWQRVEREDPEDGWQRVFHCFDVDRAGQNRGVSVFAPILPRLKMLARYYGVELQAATVASVFGTFVKSPFDKDLVQDSLTTSADKQMLGGYQQLRADWALQRPAMLNGVRVPTLAPGEDIVSVASQRPHANFSPFTREMLRGFAAVLGISTEQVSWDYSDTNYSSARAAIVEAEKTFKRRVGQFNRNYANPVYCAWLGEAMERGELPLPAGAPDFVTMRNAYARCRWLGPGRGWVDPVAERQGSVLGMDAGFSTLEHECAEKEGTDWEEVLEQRRIELDRFEELGIPAPTWAGMQGATSPMGPGASDAAKKPERPQPQ